MSLIGPQNIEEFIPQKSPFVLISDLLESSEKGAVGVFHIPFGHILADGDFLSEEGLVEHMAQTASAQSGFEARKNQKDVSIGFIGQIKNLKIFQRPPLGVSIQTRMECIHILGPVRVIKCYCTLHDTPLAECEMKIVLQEKA